MGLDVYCRVVVGVPLLHHASCGRSVVKETRYSERTGKPHEVRMTANVLTLWNGNQYEEGYGEQVTQLPDLEGLEEWLDGHDLALIQTNNGGFVQVGDLIGVAIGDYLSMRGGPLTAKLPDIGDTISDVRNLLAAIGLDAEPAVYITMELNS